MTTNRRTEQLRRAGRTPEWADKRPLNEVMNDEIPYARWEKQAALIERAGFTSWVELLKRRDDERK
jgi:hypothetical protein